MPSFMGSTSYNSGVPHAQRTSIPIVAILVRGATTIVRMVIEHRERMAMIEMGLDPDDAMPEEPQLPALLNVPTSPPPSR